MDAESLIKALAKPENSMEGRCPGRSFADLCREVDQDPREQRRIEDLAALLDAEDALYEEGVRLYEAGNLQAAEPLLRRAADAGVLGAEDLLAGIAAGQEHQDDSDGEDSEDKAEDEGQEPDIGNDPPKGSGPPAPPGARDDFQQDFCPDIIHRLASHHFLLTRGLRRAFPNRAPGWRAQQLDFQVNLQRLNLWADTPHVFPINIDCIDPQVAWPVENSCRQAINTLIFLSACTSSLSSPSIIQSGDRLAEQLAGTLHPGPMQKKARKTTAADIMIRGGEIEELSPETPAHEALKILLQLDAQVLPVLDQSHCVGLVTLSDLARHISWTRGAPSIERISGILRPPVTVAHDTPIDGVRHELARAKTGMVVVLDEHEAEVGYVTADAVLDPSVERQSCRLPRESGLVTATLDNLLVHPGTPAPEGQLLDLWGTTAHGMQSGGIARRPSTARLRM